MGWLRTILLGDVGNRLDIADAEQSIDKLEHRIQHKDATIAVLREELEQQKLGLQALTRFLLEKEVIDKTELADFINKVDAEDGVVDGKLKINMPEPRPQNPYSKPKKSANISDVAGTPWENDSGYKGD